MTNQIQKQAVKDNRYIGLPETESPAGSAKRAQCQLLVNTVFKINKHKIQPGTGSDAVDQNMSLRLGPLAELGQQDVGGAGSLIGTVRTQDTPGGANERGHKSAKFDASQDISKDLGGATTDLPSKLGDISKFEDSRILKEERSIMITDQDDSVFPN